MTQPFFGAFGWASGSYNLPNGTEPIIVSDVENGVYTVSGAAVAFGDLWTDNADYIPLDPTMTVAGQGIVATFNEPNDSPVHDVATGMVLNPSLYGPVISPDTGFTALVDFAAAITEINTNCVGDIRVGMEFLDLPDYNDEWTAEGRVIYRKTFGTLSDNRTYAFLSDYNVDPADATIGSGVVTPVRMAVSFDPAGMVLASVNGQAATTFAVTPNANNSFAVFVKAIGTGTETTATLKRVNFYPLQAAGDLPALSALS